MKAMRQWLFGTYIAMIMVFQLPLLAWAETTGGTSETDNPFTKLKGLMKFNWSIFDGTEWIFWMVMIVVSGLMVYLVVRTIWNIIIQIIKISHGTAQLKDKKFWIDIGVILLFIGLIFSGALLSIFEQSYEWTKNQNVGGTGKAGTVQGK